MVQEVTWDGQDVLWFGCRRSRAGERTHFTSFTHVYGPSWAIWASLMAQMAKNLPAIWETWVQSLGWEIPLEKGMTTHSSILAWRIPLREESNGLQPMGLQTVRQDWATNTFIFIYNSNLFARWLFSMLSKHFFWKAIKKLYVYPESTLPTNIETFFSCKH